MPRKPPGHFPPYPARPHKSGKARIRIQGRDYYLGPWGSPESRQEYARLAGEYASSGAPPPKTSSLELSVAEVVARWQLEATQEYGDRRELRNFTRPLTVLVRLFGEMQASAFSAADLETVQTAMATGSWLNETERAFLAKQRQPVGWCARVVNRNVVRVRTVWRWAERKGLVPRGSAEHLSTVPGLGRQSRKARHTKPRRPATWEQVQAVLPVVPPVVAAMLELQWLTGMRPGEVVRMRAGDVSRDGPDGCWVYWLDGHKGDWRENAPEQEGVPLGPEAQKVLAPWLDAAARHGPEAYLWPPSRRRLTAHYTVSNYGTALRRACDQAGVPRFSSYALRHSAKQRITREYGIDAARAILRHTSASMTQEYAKGQDLQAAAEVARKTG